MIHLYPLWVTMNAADRIHRDKNTTNIKRFTFHILETWSTQRYAIVVDIKNTFNLHWRLFLSSIHHAVLVHDAFWQAHELKSSAFETHQLSTRVTSNMANDHTSDIHILPFEITGHQGIRRIRRINDSSCLKLFHVSSLASRWQNDYLRKHKSWSTV